MLQTTVPIPSLDGITITGGRVNAYKALVAVGDGELELSVTPPTESVLLSGSTQAVFVVVSDLFAITNATVEGVFIGGMEGSLTFRNDGVAPDVTAGDNIFSAEFEVPIGVSELLVQITATAPDKVSIEELVRWYVAEPPTNDNFADANKIPTGGTVLYSNNKFATLEIPQEPLHAGVPTVDATLWWTWSPGYNNRALVDTAGSEIDTVVAVYTNKPLNNVREIASVDDAGGREQGFLQFDALHGVTYYIVVGGASTNEMGSIRLRVEPGGQPDVLPPLVAFTVPTDGMVVSTNWLDVSGIAEDPSPASGVAQVSVKLVSDPVGKRAKGTTNWTAKIQLQPGVNTILAQAADFARNTSEFARVQVTYLPPTTPNDHFANALALEGTSGVVPASNVSASREYLEPYHADNQGGRSLWYRWTSEESGVLTLATTNLFYDSLLAVYTGEQVSALTLVVGNDDVLPGSKDSAVSLGVEAGVVYYIAVDGYNGSAGDGELAYEFTPGELFTLVVSSAGNGRVSASSGDYAAGVSVTVEAFPDPGYVFERWDGSTNGAVTPFVVVMSSDHTLTARFRRASISDDFESGGFSPELNYTLSPTNSAAPWTVQSGSSASGGNYAARSGRIGASQRSVLALTEPMVAGVGSFSYRVSTEQNFDLFEFWVNGIRRASWSGASDWANYQFVVTGGTNTLEWVYWKDVFGDELEDAVFIDNINLPVVRAVPQPTITMGVSVDGTGKITMSLQGAPEGRYRIETSDSVVEWTTLTTVFTDTEGRADFSDTEPPRHSARFYRAISL